MGASQPQDIFFTWSLTLQGVTDDTFLSLAYGDLDNPYVINLLELDNADPPQTYSGSFSIHLDPGDQFTWILNSEFTKDSRIDLVVAVPEVGAGLVAPLLLAGGLFRWWRRRRDTGRPASRARSAGAALLGVILLGAGFGSYSARAHNLDQRFTYINLDPDTLDMMRARVAANLPPIQIGDTIGVILKSTPGPGTLTGVGGYLTFYLPTDGTFQVVGAEYLASDPARPGYYTAVPIKGQSIIAIGSGSIGAASTAGLIGLDLGPNINGITEAAVTSAGVHRGTIAGVYADTGIFFSTSDMTVWDSWELPPSTLNGGSRPIKPGGGQYPVLMTNNRGETIEPRTWWDASQLIGFGLSSPHAPATDPNGRGNAPWGTANVVAGPQSGYAWDFNLMDWVNAGFPSYSSPKLIGTLDQEGPWKRIQYPGSQISKDQAGLVSAALGYAGIDASNVGHDLSEASPLPPETTAVRFSFGMLELGRTEVARVYVKVLGDFTTCPFPIHGDAFGGDAGGEQAGKDHLWRYYDPTDEAIDVCGGFQKSFSRDLVTPGSIVTVTLTYFNSSYLPAINLVVNDPLPSGITYVAGSSKINGVPTPPLTTNPLKWVIGFVEPFDMVDITFDVTVSSGEYFNVATATSDNQFPKEANDTIRAAYDDLLLWDKFVSPTSVAPGGTVNYTIEIDNIGTGPNGVPLAITEYLPAGFTFVSMVSKQINGALLPDALFALNASNPSQPVFTIGTGIQAGQSLVLTFKVLVSEGVPPGTYCNSFRMTYEGKVVSSPPDACVNVGGGSIGDTIWRDWDGDGIQDPGEEGIPGIQVQLTSYGPDGQPGGGDDTTTTLTTDASGYYNFEGLVDGNYLVTILNPPSGYTPTYDPDGGTAHQAAVTLANNSGTDLIDFGYKPAGTGSIGDKVFDDKNNNGSFGGSDAGIPNVTVNLYEDTTGNGEIDEGDLLIATDVSDANGEYLFSNLALGLDYIVDVVATDPDLVNYYAEKGQSLSPTTALEYSILDLAGEDIDNDFGFRGVDPASIGDTVFFDTDGDGDYTAGVDLPLANITVSLYYDANGDGIAQPEEFAAADSTDATGLYGFSGLAPERYIVVVDSADPDLPGGVQGLVPQYVVTLGPGENYVDADFPFVEIFTKTVDLVSADGGDILTYTLKLNLPGDQLYQNLTVCDPVPSSDVTYYGASAGAVVNGGYTPAAPVNGLKDAVNSTVLDQFNANGSYAGNDGTADWLANWAETGDDGAANGGGILVAGNRLRIDFNNTAYSSDGDYIERSANLSEAASAAFTYNLAVNELDASEYVYVEVKGSGTAWVLVDTVQSGIALGNRGPFDLKSILQAASPAQSLANPTAIRFRRGSGSGNDQIEFDNVQIAYATPSTTTTIAVTPTQVGSGGTLTVTMTVGSSVAMTDVTPSALTPTLTDGAAASLATGPTPASASISAGGTTTFTWTYTVTDTAAPAGTVKFAGQASGAIVGGTSYTFASATSGTAQVIPPGAGTVCWDLGSHTQPADGLRIAGASIYALRGNGSGTDKEFWLYDRATKSWNNPTDPADIDVAVAGGGSLTTDGTYVYALEGKDTKEVRRYTVGNPGSWAALPDLADKVNNGGAIAYHAPNGKLYALRGAGTKTFSQFTFTAPGSLTGTWIKTIAQAPVNVRDGGALVSAGNYLYALQGDGKKGFYRYDPAANSGNCAWSKLKDAPGNVDDCGAMVA
ncbi:MAG: DUF11 domain-containing protein, partial [Verrucomicrobia bacterium]|nr:DUF11 domain-containing protein [Verrucomicrobiota bacterium]